MPTVRHKRRRWLMLLITTLVGCGVWFAYNYLLDNDRLVALLRARAGKYLRDSRIDVARIQPNLVTGDVVITQASIWQVFDRRQFLAVRIPWIRVRQNPKLLAEGKFAPSDIVIVQPALRLIRRDNGEWNLEHALADKLPKTKLARLPSITLEKGTVELVRGGPGGPGIAVLRDVSVKLVPAKNQTYALEMTARGDSFERLRIEGSLDPQTGALAVKGDLVRLALGETLKSRLPAEVQTLFERLGLAAGELDLNVARFTYDRSAQRKFGCEAVARLQGGVFNCIHAPFSLSDVSAEATIRDDKITLSRAEGFNGPTIVRAWGSCGLADPATGPFEINVQASDLEFDRRLRDWTPAQFAKLWNDYQPAGRANLALHAARTSTGAPVTKTLRLDCRDVGLKYHLFPFAVEHVHGTLGLEDNTVTLDFETLIGGKPATAKGTILNPGPNAHVQIKFHADRLPIDRPLLTALPAVARRAVDQFHPSGAVAADALVERFPPDADSPSGRVEVRAGLDLDDSCAIRWDGLPYPISGLTGKLVIAPDSWSFRDMKGSNGQAEIRGDGWVKKVAGDRLAGEIHLKAHALPFDQQLYDALPEAWKKTWKQLNPSGSSRLDARIGFDPKGQSTHLEIVPERDTRVRLVVHRPASPGDPGGLIVFPHMEDVHGKFNYDNGLLTMTDVGFQFHGADVRLTRGAVRVEDTGQFELGVSDLSVADFRLDAGIRRLMPRLMAQFAQKLDDGKTLALRSKALRIGWSGKPGDNAWCSWRDALIIFNGNTFAVGMPLEHMQGQLDHVAGLYSGDRLWTKGVIRLASVSLLGQQVTELTSDVELTRESALFRNLKGVLLGGTVAGAIEVSLDEKPRYDAELSLDGAQLSEYAKTLQGKQSFRGLVSGKIRFNGVGNDIHTLQGSGEAHIREGDLGSLPGYLRLVKVINLSPATKTLFDTADLKFKIINGESYLDPIVFKGDAFSLHGSGTLDPQGDLDLQLRILYGRDAIHIPIISTAARDLSGQFLAVRVTGAPAYPQFKLDALHPVSSILRRPALRRESRGLRE